MCSMAILSVFICYFGLHTGIGFHYSLVYSLLNFFTTSVSVSLAGSRAPPPSPVALTIHLGDGEEPYATRAPTKIKLSLTPDLTGHAHCERRTKTGLAAWPPGGARLHRVLVRVDEDVLLHRGQPGGAGPCWPLPGCKSRWHLGPR